MYPKFDLFVQESVFHLKIITRTNVFDIGL